MSRHENGPCSVQYSSIYNFRMIEIDDPAILIDTSGDTVILLKYGNKDMVMDYYDTVTDKYAAIGMNEFCSGMHVIVFNVKSGFAHYDDVTKAKFTVDEACTLINWLNNHILTSQLTELLESDESTIHGKLHELAEIGF